MHEYSATLKVAAEGTKIKCKYTDNISKYTSSHVVTYNVVAILI